MKEAPTGHRTASHHPHVEVHLSSRGEDVIRVICECSLDQDHTYADWLKRYAPRLDIDADSIPDDLALRSLLGSTGPKSRRTPQKSRLDLYIEQMLARNTNVL